VIFRLSTSGRKEASRVGMAEAFWFGKTKAKTSNVSFVTRNWTLLGVSCTKEGVW